MSPTNFSIISLFVSLVLFSPTLYITTLHFPFSAFTIHIFFFFHYFSHLEPEYFLTEPLCRNSPPAVVFSPSKINSSRSSVAVVIRNR
ncbi:hypothetical protein P8452_51009 [Trifolium repens]|nr:hypothetical protein P8452_51009 [Trifolium repens]